MHDVIAEAHRPAATIARRQDLVGRHVGDQFVVVPYGSAIHALRAVFAFNDSAEVLWEALARPTSEATLVQRLEDTFEVSRAQAEADVAAFVATLQGAGLLA